MTIEINHENQSLFDKDHESQLGQCHVSYHRAALRAQMGTYGLIFATISLFFITLFYFNSQRDTMRLTDFIAMDCFLLASSAVLSGIVFLASRVIIEKLVDNLPFVKSKKNYYKQSLKKFMPYLENEAWVIDFFVYMEKFMKRHHGYHDEFLTLHSNLKHLKKMIVEKNYQEAMYLLENILNLHQFFIDKENARKPLTALNEKIAKQSLLDDLKHQEIDEFYNKIKSVI